MAFGDVGGAVTELILTCRTIETGSVDIDKGDAVRLVGDYTVDTSGKYGAPVFGQALRDETENGVDIPVNVRGVAIFEYSRAGGSPPQPDGVRGVCCSGVPGKVTTPINGVGSGLTLKVDEKSAKVHVLL